MKGLVLGHTAKGGANVQAEATCLWDQCSEALRPTAFVFAVHFRERVRATCGCSVIAAPDCLDF